MDVYGRDFVTGYSNLVAVISEPSRANISVWYQTEIFLDMDVGSEPYDWYVLQRSLIMIMNSLMTSLSGDYPSED